MKLKKILMMRQNILNKLKLLIIKIIFYKGVKYVLYKKMMYFGYAIKYNYVYLVVLCIYVYFMLNEYFFFLYILSG